MCCSNADCILILQVILLGILCKWIWMFLYHMTIFSLKMDLIIFVICFNIYGS
jgi:hypothetical protein